MYNAFSGYSTQRKKELPFDEWYELQEAKRTYGRDEYRKFVNQARTEIGGHANGRARANNTEKDTERT